MTTFVHKLYAIANALAQQEETQLYFIWQLYKWTCHRFRARREHSYVVFLRNRYLYLQFLTNGSWRVGFGFNALGCILKIRPDNYSDVIEIGKEVFLSRFIRNQMQLTATH